MEDTTSVFTQFCKHRVLQPSTQVFLVTPAGRLGEEELKLLEAGKGFGIEAFGKHHCVSRAS